MGAVKLCVHKTAKTPYFVEATGVHLFSIEELAYYLNENIYLMDDRIVGEKLYSWIEWDLEMPTLAEKLRAGRNQGNHIYNQVMTILQASEYYTEEELLELSEKIKSISGLQTQERMKFKADELMQNENYWAAITEYEKILSIRQSSRLSVEFYARVWNNLAGCYARVFLFKKAAACFESAYQFQKIPEYKERAYDARRLDAYVSGAKENILDNFLSEELKISSERKLKILQETCKQECTGKAPKELLGKWEKNYSKISCI